MTNPLSKSGIVGWLKEGEMKNLNAILEAARAKWPECVDPQIIVTERKAVIVAVYKGDTGVVRALPSWELYKVPDYPQERIELEEVGGFLLGYGPVSNVLCIGRDTDG